MITRLRYTCGLVLLAFTANALAQDLTGARPDSEKKFRVFAEGRRQILLASILPPSRDCVDGKFEVTVRNGEAALSMKEVEIAPAPNAVKFHSGQGMAEYILGTGNCRVSIRVVPAE
jgi:hypothetical protein